MHWDEIQVRNTYCYYLFLLDITPLSDKNCAVWVYMLVLWVFCLFWGYKYHQCEQVKQNVNNVVIRLYFFTSWWISQKSNKTLIAWAGRHHSELCVCVEELVSDNLHATSQSLDCLRWVASCRQWRIGMAGRCSGQNVRHGVRHSATGKYIFISPKAICPSGADTVRTGKWWGH